MPDQDEPPGHHERKRGDADKKFARKYFTLLLGQYRTMTRKVNDPAASAEAERIASIPVEQITWEEIYNFELAILKLEPVETLRRKTWVLREEYQELASPDEKAYYVASRPPDPAVAPEPELRADMVKLQEELNWAYTILWVQEECRSKLTRSVILITLLGIALFGVLLWSVGGFSANLTLAAVVFAGITGGCISTVSRIQKLQLGGNSDLNLRELERGKLSIYVSPFLGGIFAVVLYVIFASEYIKSGLFPDYPKVNPPLLYDLFPVLHGVELAKLLVWSFIAGFAEQFVPDRLKQLTARAAAEEQKEKTETPTVVGASAPRQ